MKKYWHVMKIGIENTLVYRFNFFFRAAVSLLPLLATIYLWQTIYRGQPTAMAGYTLAGMTSYYLLVTIVDTLTAVNEDDWQIAADIKDGNISQFLLKPMDYLYYRICLFISGKMVFTAISLAPVGLFAFCMRRYLVAPSGWDTAGWFALSLLLTGMLQFLMSYTMALLAFWLLEISTIVFILFAVEYIAGGHLFPLNILPAGLAAALNWTPFPYLLYFPVSVYLGNIHGTELWRGLAAQIFWVVLFYFLARWVWSRGIRSYTAAGG